jgi:hypothetical protein
VFLPWAETTIMVADPPSQPGGSYKLKHTVNQSHPGYQFWHGTSSSLVFLALFLFLVVVGPLRPIPWWRSAVQLVGAMGVIAIVLLGFNYRHAALESDFVTGRLVVGGLGLVNHLAAGLAAGLTLLAALEMRARVVARQPGQGPTTEKTPGAEVAETDAASDPAAR